MTKTPSRISRRAAKNIQAEPGKVGQDPRADIVN